MNKINFLDEISNFIFTSKYARYDEKKQRRETWDEAVTRVEKMHLKKYASLPKEDKDKIHEVFNLVREKYIVPSMRSMQFGGKAVEAHNARLYNCAVRHIDSPRSFSEVFYMLLAGCGVGIGVGKFSNERLPNLVDAKDKTGTVITYVVEDTIEGWADTIEALINCYFKGTAYTGRKIVFDYSRIRARGTPIKTGGGKAPGYKGLKQSLTKIKRLLDDIIEERKQTRLKSIDVYDILMHCADAVLSGGVRRSAMSVVFDKDDLEMMNSKTGDWIKTNPQRARSNNSVLLIRDEVTLDEFKFIVDRTKEFGEPGFVFGSVHNQLFNPCYEINFIPILDGVCGMQVCNLTSQNGVKITTPELFRKCTEAATILGTLQAGYTDFKYISHTSKKLTEEESLLGVSITGIMDNPDILLDPALQKENAQYAVEVNKLWASKLGINPASRVTCVKPEGTSSLVLGSASGIHPHHARQYVRRVQCNVDDNVYNHFNSSNSHASEPSKWSAAGTDNVISFPITVPDKAIVKADLSALQHLDYIKSTYNNWVVPGTSDTNTKPITHNVSCTVIVKDEEWDSVIQYIYDNRYSFAAVSLIPFTGDKMYVQAPMEAVVTPEDKAKFDELVAKWVKVNYATLQENKDETELVQTASCNGNACELVFNS